MKEIAFKKQGELEEIYTRAHIEIDTEAAREKILAIIDAGNVEPSELIADMESQISKAKEEALSRKEILDRVEKWMSACEEESWLEDYNRVLCHFRIICVSGYFRGYSGGGEVCEHNLVQVGLIYDYLWTLYRNQIF